MAEWRQGGVTLITGDCLDVLAGMEAESVDAVITDPPYAVSLKNEASEIRRGARPSPIRLHLGDWDRGQFLVEPFMEEVERVLRPGGSIVAFTSEYLLAGFIASSLKHERVGAWHKTNPTPQFRRGYQQATELFVWQTKKGAPAYWGGNGVTHNVLEGPICQGEERTEHPTQKPLWLMKRLILNHCPPGGLILDPFMGVGTTCVAAQHLGRRAIGIELNPEYVEIAKKRLAQMVLL